MPFDRRGQQRREEADDLIGTSSRRTTSAGVERVEVER
jgi:hypothetical protein